MNIAEIIKIIFSSRRHSRFSVNEGVLVVIENLEATHGKVHVLEISERKQLQLLDLSEGGCAFIYNGSRQDLEESGFLSLKFHDIPFIERIGYATKSDIILADTIDQEKPLRRRGVEFHWIGVVDRKKLKEFIKQYAISRI